MWQRLFDRRTRDAAITRLREAGETGADRPLTQHPQVQPYVCIGCGSCIRACPEGDVLGLIDGVARLVQASHCIGHGLCEQACPVGAITVGLGELATAPDMPLLDEHLQTSVRGVYIAGELGGYALIRNAIDQGRRVVDTVAELGAAQGRDLDVLVVGSGPAGLAATFQAIDRNLSYLTIDQDDLGGTVRKYPRRKLVLTQPVELPLGERLACSEYSKEELVEFFEDASNRHRAQVRTRVKLIDVARDGDALVANTSAGPVRTRSLILALGRRGTPRRLGVPGEESERVLYRLIDAASYRGMRLLVVGGGDSAIDAALALADQPDNEVVLSYRKSGFFRLKQRNAERIERYAAAGRVRVVFASNVERFEDGHAVLRTEHEAEQLGNDFTFVFAGGEPPSPLLRRIGVRLHGDERAA